MNYGYINGRVKYMSSSDDCRVQYPEAEWVCQEIHDRREETQQRIVLRLEYRAVEKDEDQDHGAGQDRIEDQPDILQVGNKLFVQELFRPFPGIGEKFADQQSIGDQREVEADQGSSDKFRGRLHEVGENAAASKPLFQLTRHDPVSRHLRLSPSLVTTDNHSMEEIHVPDKGCDECGGRFVV